MCHSPDKASFPQTEVPYTDGAEQTRIRHTLDQGYSKKCKSMEAGIQNTLRRPGTVRHYFWLSYIPTEQKCTLTETFLDNFWSWYSKKPAPYRHASSASKAHLTYHRSSPPRGLFRLCSQHVMLYRPPFLCHHSCCVQCRHQSGFLSDHSFPKFHKIQQLPPLCSFILPASQLSNCSYIHLGNKGEAEQGALQPCSPRNPWK